MIALMMFGKCNNQRIVRKEIIIQNYSNFNTYTQENNYLLIIDKINLSYVLSETETLETGLEIHNVSYEYNMPLVVMGHSGLGPNVYFNNLDQIVIGDEIIICKNGIQYTYEVNEIFYHEKGNDLYIEKNQDYLYLITCDKYDMQKQLIISSKIVKIA